MLSVFISNMAYIDGYALCKQITLVLIIFKGFQVPESEWLRTLGLVRPESCLPPELYACRRFLGQLGAPDIFPCCTEQS